MHNVQILPARQPPRSRFLRTAVLTYWHEEPRGHFTVPAGAELAALTLDAVKDPHERTRLQDLLKREEKDGGAPLLVWLEGRARVIDRKNITRD